MVDIAAVKDPVVDPKKGKPRPRSEVSFPYFSLSKSIDAVRVIHEKAGGRCSRAQLASLLGYSAVKNGGFLSRISAAKMFGLMEEYGETLMLSDRAKSIVSAVRESDADKDKVDAFLDVDLYNLVFTQFDGQLLPGEAGLKHVLANQHKVVPKQIDQALRLMLESADTAGFFRVTGNRSKMVKPIVSSEPQSNQSPLNSIDTSQQNQSNGTSGDEGVMEKEHTRRSSGNGGNGGGGDGRDPDPALLGLLRNLPEPGSKLGPKRRAALIEAFKSTINFIYPEEEDSP